MDIETEIADVANQGDYDLLLVGLGKSIWRYILEESLVYNPHHQSRSFNW
jgi:hypothetical protein